MNAELAYITIVFFTIRDHVSPRTGDAIINPAIIVIHADFLHLQPSERADVRSLLSACFCVGRKSSLNLFWLPLQQC